jgi:hypothetical protein
MGTLRRLWLTVLFALAIFCVLMSVAYVLGMLN